MENNVQIRRKYELKIDKAINEYKKKVAEIREVYKDDISDEMVSEETNKLKARAEQIEQDYISELENHVNNIKKELRKQETMQKAKEMEERERILIEKAESPLQAAILEQLERSNNMLEAIVILDSKNEDAILSLIDKHKENKEMLNLIKSKADKTISKKIDRELQNIEFNSIEKQIQRLEGNIRYEKSINKLGDKVIQATNEIDNPYF